MRSYVAIFLMIILLFSCKNETPSEVDVSHINLEIDVQRFEVDFYNTTEKTLDDTKEKYPLFFPESTSDSLWLKKILDGDERELYQETLKKYESLESLEKQLISLFKHIKYYDKSFLVPKITTVISNIDYDYRIIYSQTSLIISLDCYLGDEHPFYGDYPRYIRENNTEDHIVVDVAEKIISRQVPRYTNDRSFLGKMIEEGKKMYILDMYLPAVSDKEKIGYTEGKHKWAVDNEEQVWKYFLGKNLLYSTDTKLNKQFLDNAPFSKFYLSQDNLSPGRIGVFIGWHIVRSYMKNNDATLQQLLQIKSQDLFLKSKYKPNK